MANPQGFTVESMPAPKAKAFKQCVHVGLGALLCAMGLTPAAIGQTAWPALSALPRPCLRGSGVRWFIVFSARGILR